MSLNSTPTKEEVAVILFTLPSTSIINDTLTTDCKPSSLAVSGKTKYFSMCSEMDWSKQILWFFTGTNLHTGNTGNSFSFIKFSWDKIKLWRIRIGIN